MVRRMFCSILLASVAVVLGLLVLSGEVSAQSRAEEALDRVRAVQQSNTDWLMEIDGVAGTAIGLGQGAQPVLLVLLEYGGVRGIPEQLDGVLVRPLLTGKIYALDKPPGTPGGGNGGGGGGDSGTVVDPTSRIDRPVPIGVSTGHPAITAGTISCRVTDGSNVFALSNNHVYADENLAHVGDDVIQPGAYDGGSLPDDYIGTLAAFVEIDFSANANNVVDAAIASTTVSLLGNSTPSDGYGTPKSTTIAPVLNQKVEKFGRTSGLTTGQVYAFNATVNVGYSTGVARFVKQIIITPGGFSAPGDSGSLVVVEGKGKDKADDRKPVGLLFAGSSLVTIANPIDDVLDAFGVSIDGE